MNVFSSSQRRSAGTEPAASFDPSRIGDPVDPSYDRPAIGFGETGFGAPSGGGESRRQVVGFAPWDVEPTERYVTEFSFKRHHDVLRASATGDQPEGGIEEPWQTPDIAQAEGTIDLDDTVELDGEAPMAEVVEKKVPFYKREISFRRKGAASEETSDPGAEAVESDALLVAHSDVADDAVLQPDQHDDPIAEVRESDSVVVAEVVASSEDTPELSVAAPVDLDADDGPNPAAVARASERSCGGPDRGPVVIVIR
ncbi:MAG: hypothetical protein LH654_06370 [Thermoleophilia bacterium]|nr:hypothetical protein [Thermoleophilia bacterium]